jgi:hypothetical protein
MSKGEILRFAKLITENGSPDDYHAIEKAKSKRIQKKWNLLNFYNEQINLP